MLFANDITFGTLTTRYGAKHEDFLSDFPVKTEGEKPSMISLLVYLKSLQFQEDQKALMKDFNDAMFRE